MRSAVVWSPHRHISHSDTVPSTDTATGKLSRHSLCNQSTTTKCYVHVAITNIHAAICRLFFNLPYDYDIQAVFANSAVKISIKTVKEVLRKLIKDIKSRIYD